MNCFNSNNKVYRLSIAGTIDESEIHRYIIDRDFFDRYENNLLEEGEIEACVRLEKSQNSIIVRFEISGDVELECDRSLDKFRYPIDIERTVIYKFGDTDEEVDLDLYTIGPRTSHIDIAQHLHDFIIFEIPLKKLHPRYDDNDDNSDE